jgi:hypothetical protein
MQHALHNIPHNILSHKLCPQDGDCRKVQKMNQMGDSTRLVEYHGSIFDNVQFLNNVSVMGQSK